MAAVNRRRQLLLLLLLCRRRRRRRRQKRMWVRKIFQSRSKFHALIAEMTLVDHESFYKYFHMTPQRFSQLLSCVGPFIKRQNTRLREAIPPDESALKYTPSFLTCNVKVEQNSSPYVTLISITCRATRECECPYVTLRSTYVTLSDQCESALSPYTISIPSV